MAKRGSLEWKENIKKSLTGRPPAWNKDLTKETDERIDNYANSVKKTIVENKLGFQKGHIPWNKDRKMDKESEEYKNHLIKLDHARKNRKFGEVAIKNMSAAQKLRYKNGEKPVGFFGPHTEDSKLKIGAASKSCPRTEEWCSNISKALTGRKLSEDHRAKCKNGAFAKAMKYMDGDGIFFNTKPEIEMKRCLAENGIHYIFQYPVEEIEHCYVADFYLPLYNIILEVDGRWSHNYPDGKEIDVIRTKELEDAGYRVLRFWEGEFDAQSLWREI